MFLSERLVAAGGPNLQGRGAGVLRLIIASIGLGLGTAMAADLANFNTTPPEQLSSPVAGFSSFRLFDPGYIVDHLPFRLTIAQTVSYNDNVQNTPSGFTNISGVQGRSFSRGDFYSDTTMAFASRFPIGADALFLNGSYSPRRYFTDTFLNADNIAINGGLSFGLLDRCTGALVAGYTQYQGSLDETVGFGVSNNRATSFNETAQCQITGHIVGIFNSGISRNEQNNAGGLSAQFVNFSLNSYTQYYASGGLDYSLSGLDHLTGLVTLTTRDFDNRPVNGIFGLARETQQNDFQLTYSRIFSPKLDFSGSVGVTVFSTPGGASRETTSPTYSFQLTAHPTPKVSLFAGIAQSSGAPQNVVADLQQSESQSVGVSYSYSPKLSFSTTFSHSTSKNSTLSNANGIVNAPAALLFVNTNTYNESVVASYRATPLLSATAAYTHVEREDSSRANLSAASNIFRVGLVYTR